MKHYFLMISFLICVSVSFGQLPSASPTPSTPHEKERAKPFGWSLDKYKNKKEKSKTSRVPQEKEKSVVLVDEDTIRVDTDLVVNDVLVTDQKSNIITGLTQEDFILTEDGSPQTIEMFSRGANIDVPRSIVLIVDRSVLQRPYLKKSIEAANILVDKLATNDKMAIVTDDLNLQLNFTQDKDLLKKALNSLEKMDPWLGMAIEFDTLMAVLNEMFDEEERQRIVIFQGDGAGAIWLKPDKEHPYPVSYSTLYNSGMKWTGEEGMRKFGFSEVRESIERSGATIYSVAVGPRFTGLSQKEQVKLAETTLTELSRSSGWKNITAVVKKFRWAEAERKTAGQVSMYRVAELSGGFSGIIEKPDDAEAIYSEIFTVIENRYVIGYYPTNQERDGKRREVKVEVRGHPEYIVTGRKAYYLSQ